MCVFQRLHIVLIPLFTAFYNIAAILGLYPKLAESEKRLPHHLRFDNPSAIAGASSSLPGSNAGVATTGAAKSASDIASERRRAKALKVALVFAINSHVMPNCWWYHAAFGCKNGRAFFQRG